MRRATSSGGSSNAPFGTLGLIDTLVCGAMRLLSMQEQAASARHSITTTPSVIKNALRRDMDLNLLCELGFDPSYESISSVCILADD